MKQKLAIVTSHPIQYNAPFFKILCERAIIDIKVYYTWSQAENDIFDPDFGHIRSWDRPLLTGYPFEFIKNVSKKPSSSHFFGIINPDILEKINLWQPSAILIFGWAFSSHLKVLKYYKNKIPVYFRGDSTLLDETVNFTIKKLIKKIFLKWVYSFVDIAIYTGTENRKYFRKYGLKDHQLIFGPHAVDNNFFASNTNILEAAKRLRIDLGINEKERLFLFAGKLQRKKNPSILIESFKTFSLPGFHLLIVGNGELEFELKSMSKDLSNVHFLPFQNQSKMPLVYHASDIFILPSVGPGETWGLAINEAMASGKGVIVSNKVGCSVDLVKNGKNGFIIKPGEINELNEILKTLSVSEHLFDEFKVNSLLEISKWSYDSLARTIEKICLGNQVKNEILK